MNSNPPIPKLNTSKDDNPFTIRLHSADAKSNHGRHSTPSRDDQFDASSGSGRDCDNDDDDGNGCGNSSSRDDDADH